MLWSPVSWPQVSLLTSPPGTEQWLALFPAPPWHLYIASGSLQLFIFWNIRPLLWASGITMHTSLLFLPSHFTVIAPTPHTAPASAWPEFGRIHYRLRQLWCQLYICHCKDFGGRQEMRQRIPASPVLVFQCEWTNALTSAMLSARFCWSPSNTVYPVKTSPAPSYWGWQQSNFPLLATMPMVLSENTDSHLLICHPALTWCHSTGYIASTVSWGIF